MEKDIVEKFIISKEDLKNNFNCKRVITKDKLEKYYLEKNVKKFSHFLTTQYKIIWNDTEMNFDKKGYK